MFNEPYKSLIDGGAKVVSFSGKVLNKSYHNEFPADRYIQYSDHSDFNNLNDFIEKCTPNILYLEHGQIEEFSYHISKILNNQQIFYIH